MTQTVNEVCTRLGLLIVNPANADAVYRAEARRFAGDSWLTPDSWLIAGYGTSSLRSC
jgi:hypothetical protein